PRPRVRAGGRGAECETDRWARAGGRRPRRRNPSRENPSQASVCRLNQPVGTHNEGASVTKRWTQRPPGSTWGDWGEDDELGRINLLTPDKVLEGVREVEAGISFCLSLP